MARHTRKGRNPGPVDEWLDTLGYYRKNVAYDETCLFRAVSEQMYACQLFHEKIRIDCIAYGRDHHEEFQDLMSKSDWDHYLERLKKHMAVCGTIEVNIISKTYKKGVLLFDGLTRCMKEVTQGVYSDYLLLCHMGEDHYDVVYKKEYIQEAGFCQSIIYKLLYENVFEIPKVNTIVQTMLYQKPPFFINADLSDPESNNNCANNKTVEGTNTDANNNLEISNYMKSDQDDKYLNDYEYMLKTNIAPFPFKVAKTLDPTIYRNIEYDTWTEMRKEMRLGEWYYGDNNLIQGTGCVYRDANEELKCYIQEILRDEKCVIYITSRAEKRTVKLCDLRPEEDAKPWPLPYRFSKNLVLSIPKIELSDKKHLRKKRDKKRTSSNDSETAGENGEGTINVYEGAPLQMQSELSSTLDIETANKESSSSQHTPTYNYSEYSWDENAVALQHTPEPLIWPAGPSTPQNIFTFNSKPVIPTTPEIYTDARYFYTNDAYGRYNVWANGEYVAPFPPPDQIVPPSPHGTEMIQSPDFNYYFSDGSYSPACYTPISDGKTYTTTIVPQLSPQIELYPPMYPAPPPGTPVIITSDMAEILLPPQPPQMIYSPAIEVPFIQTPPYIYPPTPPAAWYPSGINSQGFIFPAVNNPQPNFVEK